MKSRWKLLSIVALLGIALLALAPWKARAAGTPEHVVVVSENKVLHSPEELAEMLRAHGADEAGVQRVLTFERRLNDAERRGLSREQISRLAEQWAQELFLNAPAETQQGLLAPTIQSTWYYHTVGIYACCSSPRAHARWSMPGHRSFYAWFRGHSGTYYWVHGYCSYNSCTVYHWASGEHNWDYHTVALPDAWPYWHVAGCGY